ncbi:hypothetical protein HMPREF9144_0201 [Prevotella pallens ATCC 700821]|uniref:Uncharacterized protein n=1 Tax=Prevotella pallens ATCC 700821 TaxID=997353 RepID=F9DEW1_9BACT|nr:hypothetical protein HMPREF9144_0201 [Prevotella pallens ATCC 700821]
MINSLIRKNNRYVLQNKNGSTFSTFHINSFFILSRFNCYAPYNKRK